MPRFAENEIVVKMRTESRLREQAAALIAKQTLPRASTRR